MLAASIIRPMMERASTVWPSFVTVIWEEKRAAASTNLAEARACSPFLLTIVALASRRKGDSTTLGSAGEVDRARAHIFPARIDCVLDGLVERQFVANIDELDEARKVGAGQDFHLAPLQERERQIAGRAAIHVG